VSKGTEYGSENLLAVRYTICFRYLPIFHHSTVKVKSLQSTGDQKIAVKNRRIREKDGKEKKYKKVRQSSAYKKHRGELEATT
jgi:hypothetical protein